MNRWQLSRNEEIPPVVLCLISPFRQSFLSNKSSRLLTTYSQQKHNILSLFARFCGNSLIICNKFIQTRSGRVLVLLMIFLFLMIKMQPLNVCKKTYPPLPLGRPPSCEFNAFEILKYYLHLHLQHIEIIRNGSLILPKTNISLRSNVQSGFLILILDASMLNFN